MTIAATVLEPTSTHPRDALVSVTGVGHSFGTVAALRPLDLRIEPGEIVALLGPSGCGKTTLLRLLAGLLEPTTGTVARQPNVGTGFVFQRPVLLAWRSTLAHVLLPWELHGRPRAEGEARARALLELVGLGGFERHRPGQLSGGMQQRVAIARALIERPSVLFLDEPFSALDEMTREDMNVELLRVFEVEPELEAAVLVTHSIEEAAFLADRVVVLSGRPGTVLGTVETGLPRPRTLDHKDSERFVQCVAELRHLLRSSRA
jgi:NitT/TauT family transport system ATP-binding protein